VDTVIKLISVEGLVNRVIKLISVEGLVNRVIKLSSAEGLVNRVIKFKVQIKRAKLLTSLAAVSFSRWTVLHTAIYKYV
jgi:hypothetical protein